MFFQKMMPAAASAKSSVKPLPLTPAASLALLAQVTSALDAWLLSAGVCLDAVQSPLLVAYSGGLDSTVLLHALLAQMNTLAEARGKKPRRVIAAYYHHNWHGTPARELPRVLKNAAQFGVPLVVCSPNLKTPHTETEARQDRYAALAQLATSQGANTVLTAHHQDDQVETILFRLFRGTGLEGMAGIQPVQRFSFSPSVAIARPFLNVPREALAAYATAHDLHFYEDPSNADTQHARNRIRHDILATLETQFPQVRQSLLRFSALCVDNARLADDAVRVCQEQLLDQVSDVLGLNDDSQDLAAESRLSRAQAHLPLVAFQQLAPSYQRRLLKLFLDRAGVFGSFDQIDRCLRFIMGDTSHHTARTPQKGQKSLSQSGGLFSLGKSRGKSSTSDHPRYLAVHRGVISIVTPARYQFPGGSPPALGLPVALASSEAFSGSLQASSPVFRLTVGVECLNEELQRLHKNATMLTEDGWSFFFNDNLLAQVAHHSQLMQTFLLRTPRPGDVYQTMGGKTRAFKRFLAESGLPAATRMTLPVLAFHNQIIWAQGFSEPLPASERVNAAGVPSERASAAIVPKIRAPKWLSEEHPPTHRLWISRGVVEAIVEAKIEHVADLT